MHCNYDTNNKESQLVQESAFPLWITASAIKGRSVFNKVLYIVFNLTTNLSYALPESWTDTI